MKNFQQYNDEWYAEGVALNTIAETVGTPCYVYSRATLEQQWRAFHQAFQNQPHQINYAVKANSNLAVLNILAQLGSGFDIVSEGELRRVLKAGGLPEKIIFSGVGKTKVELKAALEIGVGCINIESKAELERLNDLAILLRKKATIAIRVNPDVDPKSHPYISTGLQENKFGINITESLALYQQALTLPGIHIQGIAFHIGSQITTLSPFLEALNKILALIEKLKSLGITLTHLNVGGGLGVRYQNEAPPNPKEYINALLTAIQTTQKKAGVSVSDLIIHIEPGRAIAAEAGVLLTRVEYIKTQGLLKSFAIVDAAMNDLLRPALYNAWQEIVPLNTKTHPAIPAHTYDIVGPVCETADFLGKDRVLTLQAGNLLMICTAGAYGFSMSSNYNSRPRAAEVMVDGDRFQVVRPRESIQDLLNSETVL
ncbi:MAG TPA: diaminopimelate decarboxylase [Gammaproteobacteria bacterium]|nr:diaminopimelate decarboxylase [Gammaproteobacteria bacterium]